MTYHTVNKTWLIALLLVLLAPLQTFAQDIPEPMGFVNDFKGLLSESQRQQLDRYLTDFAQSTTNEIAVAIMDLPQDETAETYTYKVATAWGVFGAEGKNNGVLLAVYPEARKVRIEVGYALEPAIPDLAARRIIEQDITPYFRQNNYYEGLRRATEALATLAKGEIDEATRRRYYGQGGGSPEQTQQRRETMGYVMLAIILIVFLIIAYGNRGGGKGPGGGGRRGRGYYHGGPYIWWGGSGGWGSGGGGSWGGGGGSFGGFGGGGGGFGGFGGGGASGGW